MKAKSEREVAQSCPTLSDPMDYSPPGSSVHGIFQARVLEWVAIAFFMRMFRGEVLHSWSSGGRWHLNLQGCWDSLVAQMVKQLPAMRETRVRSLGREDPLEKEMTTHSSTLAWKSPWKEEHGIGYSPRGHEE